MGKFRQVIESWAAIIREKISPKRTDVVQVDIFRTERSIIKANKAIERLEQDTVLRRRLDLMNRRKGDVQSPKIARQEKPLL